MAHTLIVLTAVAIGILLTVGAYLLLKGASDGQVRLAGGLAFDRADNPVVFWSFVSVGALLGNLGVGMTIVTVLMLFGVVRL
jgi:hypothetical protein